MEAQSRIWELMAREISGELNPAEKEELQHVLEAHPELLEDLQMLQRTAVESQAALSFSKKEHLLNNILGTGVTEKVEMEDNPVGAARPVNMRWMWMAASFAILIISASVLYFLNIKEQEPWHVVQAKRGARSKVALPDGSVVILNAGSELSYPAGFNKDKREVKLIGEGYFQVAKQAAHPFIINTSVVMVKVLGTEFNLRAYPDETKTETSLISGAVEITIKNKEEQKILLKPNQKIAIDNRITEEVNITMKEDTAVSDQAGTGKGLIQVRIDPLSKDPVDHSIIETAWLNYRLVFRNERFEQLAAEIERAYDVKVIIQREDLKDFRFSGKVKDESLSDLLKILQDTKYFNYNINSEQVIIY